MVHKKNIVLVMMVLSGMVHGIQAATAKSVPQEVQKVSEETASEEAYEKKHPERYLIDTIKVVIHSEESTDIITKSDIERPGLDGAFKSLDDLIFERLIYLDAKRFKMLPDKDAIDKQIKAVQRENNLTQDQLKAVFKAAGYTYEEGREQFALMTTNNEMLNFKIRSRLIVPEREVRAYYESHPKTEQASYQIERAVLPFTTLKSKDKFRREIEYMIKEKCLPADLEWSAAFSIDHNELAESKFFITQMKPGEISMPLEVERGFELLRLKSTKPERIVPLDDRYHEIADMLRKPYYEKLLAEYKQHLYDEASIVYL